MIPISATIEEFGRGTWVADTVTTEEPTGVFELGGETWRGTVSGTPILDGGRYRARIVGGLGKLGAQLPAKNWDGSISFSLIAKAIIAECGELAGTINAGARVAYYERANGTAGQALNELCAASGLSWWVSRDGYVHVGLERPTTSAVNAERCPQLGGDVDGSLVLNVEAMSDVHPGMLLSNGSTIRHIRWQADTKLTADCSPTQPFPERGSSFYLTVFAAKVDKQNGDGSVDVIVDGRFTLGHVRLFSGLPATKIVVKQGESVCVGFLGANRSTPYAFGFEQTGDETAELALRGDSVEVPLPPMTFAGTVGGAPATGVLSALLPKTLGAIVGPGSSRTKSA